MAKRYSRDFALDIASYELRCEGRAVKLERIPMDLLILLAQKKGDLVTRDDIRRQLWGDGVFVDTEHGINTAILKVRQALSDDTGKPRYVETVVGKGYRFVGPLQIV